MIRALVDFALNNRFVVIALALLALGWGAISFHNLPVEAYPDIADNYATIITQWPGRAAEEVEQQVTIPLEIAMNGIPQRTHIRSESLFGLSFIIIVFDDGSNNDWNRQKVTEKMAQADLPPGVQPSLGTDWSTTGQIYWYVLKSTNPKIDLMDLRSLEDFVVEKEIKSVPDIVDVSPFGGIHREYQVRVDPNKLVSYGMSIGQVEQQLSNNNVNAGGNFIETGLQQMNVRAIGLFRNVKDIEQTVLTTKSGTPLRVKDIAEVAQGPKVRLGHEGRAIRREDGVIVNNDDVIFSQVMMRKGADSGPTLVGLHAKVEQLNNGILPPGVKLDKMIDRSDLLALHFEHGAAQPGRRHDPGDRHPVPVSIQRPRGSHRGAHHSVLAAVRFHLARCDKDSRKSTFAGCSGFRHGGGRRGGHGGEHRAAYESPRARHAPAKTPPK